MWNVEVLIFSYLLGSIPNGLIFGKLIWKKDLRKVGSGNIGATNAWRSIGKTAGIFIFALDFLKGALSVFIAQEFSGEPLMMILAGFFSILGHSFSLFLKFHGGKGVATGLGVISMLMPKITAVVFLIWLAIVFVTRYVSLGSIVASICVPLLAIFFGEPTEFILLGALAAVFITVRHKENISRLSRGIENKV